MPRDTERHILAHSFRAAASTNGLFLTVACKSDTCSLTARSSSGLIESGTLSFMPITEREASASVT